MSKLIHLFLLFIHAIISILIKSSVYIITVNRPVHFRNLRDNRPQTAQRTKTWCLTSVSWHCPLLTFSWESRTLVIMFQPWAEGAERWDHQDEANSSRGCGKCRQEKPTKLRPWHAGEHMQLGGQTNRFISSTKSIRQPEGLYNVLQQEVTTTDLAMAVQLKRSSRL